MKVNYKKFWDNAFPFVTGIVILIICIALKGGTESFGKASSKPIVLDSVSIKELNLEEGNTETVIIRETGTEFTKELNYLIESHPNFEVITVTREVEGNPLTTKGYKVILKANKRGLEWETSFLLNKYCFYPDFFYTTFCFI